MIKHICVLLSLSVFITLMTGCGQKHEAYVGRYEYMSASDGIARILEIRKNGDEYFVEDEGKPPMKALPTSEGLDLNGLILSLTPDDNGIIIGGIEAKRI